MIKANELRIGNLIEYPEFLMTLTVSSIDGTDINYSYQSKECEPIPITEGILLEWGFEKFSDSEIYNKKFGKGWILSIQKHPAHKKGYIAFIEDNHSDSPAPPSVHVEYLHTLQNLWFALDGKELTNKPIN